MPRGKRRSAASGSKQPAEKRVAPPAAAAPSGRAAAAPLPDVEELLAAIESLYRDQLRPYGRILKKRLAERAGGGAPEACEAVGCDAAELRALCEGSECLTVLPEEGGEWSALLVGRPDDFIDIYDPQDTYPEALWSAARDYFQSLGSGGTEPLPGGRYTSAVALAARRLPFLSAYSLGQVCHIMQIAIAQRKLLGYFNGAIVPYDSSTSMMKSRCAREQKPLATSTAAITPEGEPLVVADWDTARDKLREILNSAKAREGPDQVPLSNVKRLFRSLYQMELSETALGHAKLTELLQDPRFGDVCTVKLQDRGYVVVPPEDDVGQLPGQPADVQKVVGLAGGRGEAADAANAWASLAWPASPSHPSASRRTRSLPKNLGSASFAAQEVSSPFGTVSVHSTGSDDGGLHDSGVASGEGAEAERVPAKFCVGEPLCLEEADLGTWTGQSPAYPFPLMTPSPNYDHASQPLGKVYWEASVRAAGLQPLKEVKEDAAGAGGEHDGKGAVSPQPRAKFCQGQPLSIDVDDGADAELQGGGGMLDTPVREPALQYQPVATPSPQGRGYIALRAPDGWGICTWDKLAQ